MIRFGLLGYPLGHSFSARYFAEKFQRGGIEAKYENFEYASVEEALAHLREVDDLKGFNVTIPYKEKIMPFLQSVSREAQEIGAVNTVRVSREDSGKVRLEGFNTDLIGFTSSIRPLLRPSIHRKALILGTGGASKAVNYGLHQLGLETRFVSRKPKEGCLTYGELNADWLNEYQVIVNCSPVGMYPHVDEAPDIPYEHLNENHLLYDLVYNPLETSFLHKGKQQGCTVKNGLEMLHLQAEAAWKIWNEKL